MTYNNMAKRGSSIPPEGWTLVYVFESGANGNYHSMIRHEATGDTRTGWSKTDLGAVASAVRKVPMATLLATV